MDLARKIEVLQKQIDDANDGRPEDLEAWKVETEVALRTVMGADHEHCATFGAIRYWPTVWSSGVQHDEEAYRVAGVKKGMITLEAAKKELALLAEMEGRVETKAAAREREQASEPGPVFIVHGHDGDARKELARVLRALTGIDPIVLHEQASAGRTIIEKFEDFASGASFAVALLTADDLGRAKDADTESPRARQNVVFEAGYFAGRLGRPRVVLLLEEGVEKPSDLDGLVYVSLDKGDRWMRELAREMDHEGIDVNWKALGSL